MRDPKRIHRILSRLGVLWYQMPDMRFGQLYHYIAETGDPYYVEDDKWEDRLEQLIEDAAERAFRKPINPDPVTPMAKEIKAGRNPVAAHLDKVINGSDT